MSRFAFTVSILEAALLQFASMIPALVAFGVLGGALYHGAPVWMPGCAILLGISAILWLWSFWRAEEPLRRTGITLLISTALWFFFYFSVFLVYFMFARHDMVSATDICFLLICGGLVFYLRRVLLRRQTQTDHVPEFPQKA